MRKILIIATLALAGVFLIRFLVGGSEDTWICKNDIWIKHGNPHDPQPTTGCGQVVTTCGSSSGTSMDLDKAKEIAQSTCDVEGILKEATTCNTITGTWWLEYEPTEAKEGCNPACVVDIVTNEAELNWRCTGLIPK